MTPELDKYIRNHVSADLNTNTLIPFSQITYRNGETVATQAWEFLAWGMELDILAPDIIKQRVRVLLDPNVCLSRAYSAMNQACIAKLRETKDKRWILLSMGFASLHQRQSKIEQDAKDRK